jgi:hypothetical protein
MPKVTTTTTTTTKTATRLGGAWALVACSLASTINKQINK